MVPIIEAPAAAIALGGLLGLGLWMLLALVPRLGRPRLAERVAPYVADVSEAARAELVRRSSDPSLVLGVVAGPAVRRLRGFLAQVVGGNEAIARRLRQAGASTTVERYRAEQLAWAVAGALTASALVLVAPAFSSLPALVRGAAVVIAALAAAVLREQTLHRAARRRLDRVSAELPTVLEFLALSLTAGEGILEATRRVARSGSGELAREFTGVATAVGAGVPLSAALAELRDGLGHPALTRALDQVLGALERGAPLAAVLAAQAEDARQEAKHRLIELAGRKEITMLIPLVFLILPVTVAFALFPGYVVLQAGF